MASDSHQPRYTWKMLSTAHIIKKRKGRKLQWLQNQLGQGFDVYDLQPSDTDLTADAIGPGEGAPECSDLASCDANERTRVEVPDAEIVRHRKNAASSGEDPSMSLPHKTASSRRKGAKHVRRTVELGELRPSVRVSGSGEEGSTDCVPETSQESLPSFQPSSHGLSSGAGIDRCEQEAAQPTLEAFSAALESVLFEQGTKVKKKKKHRRRESHDAGKVPQKKKKKRRRKERLQEGSACEGPSEDTLVVLTSKKEQTALAQREEEEEEEETREEEQEEEEETREEEMEKEDMQEVLSSRSGRKRGVLSDGTPASSRRRLFLPESLECEGAEEGQEEGDEEDQYQYLHESWNLTPEDEIRLGSWCKGPWTKQEAKLLHRNVKTYVEENEIKDLQEFLLERGRKQHLDFFKKIARGINRPLFPIYRKACRLYNTANYMGQFTEDEDREIKRLQAMHGNKWKLIGDKLERSAGAVRQRYLYMNRKEKTGQWTKEEEDRLSKSVLSAFRESARMQLDDDSEGDMPPCDAPLPDTKTWDLVSSEVGTRSAQQCRHKWYYHLCWKTSGEMWTFVDNIRLVREVSTLDVDSENSINWQALADGWPEARSGYYLRRKWAALRRFVPSYGGKDLPEILDYLYSEKVPVWQKNLERGVKGCRSSNKTTPKTPIAVDEDSDD